MTTELDIVSATDELQLALVAMLGSQDGNVELMRLHGAAHRVSEITVRLLVEDSLRLANVALTAAGEPIVRRHTPTSEETPT